MQLDAGVLPTRGEVLVVVGRRKASGAFGAGVGREKAADIEPTMAADRKNHFPRIVQATACKVKLGKARFILGRLR